MMPASVPPPRCSLRDAAPTRASGRAGAGTCSTPLRRWRSRWMCAPPGPAAVAALALGLRGVAGLQLVDAKVPRGAVKTQEPVTF
jgi:hypothetical protein